MKKKKLEKEFIKMDEFMKFRKELMDQVNNKQAELLSIKFEFNKLQREFEKGQYKEDHHIHTSNNSKNQLIFFFFFLIKYFK